MDVVSIYNNFGNRGGAQNVVVQLAHNICDTPVVLTSTPLCKIDACYLDGNTKFVDFSLKEIIKYRKSIFLSHSRKLTTILCLLNKFGLGIKLIHVAHNLFYDGKNITLFPRHIISVSNSVKENLVNYFGVNPSHVEVIYNGEKDVFKENTTSKADGITRVLIAARICPHKRQLAIVKGLKGYIPDDIQLCFAGTGEDVESLKSEIANDPHLNYEGLIDMFSDLYNYDYVCLFSEKEGLPLSLIEACMFAKPLLTNSIGPCLEVNKDGVNGLVFKNIEQFKRGLKVIPRKGSADYNRMSQYSRKKYEDNFTETQMFMHYNNYIQSIKW